MDASNSWKEWRLPLALLIGMLSLLLYVWFLATSQHPKHYRVICGNEQANVLDVYVDHAHLFADGHVLVHNLGGDTIITGNCVVEYTP